MTKLQTWYGIDIDGIQQVYAGSLKECRAIAKDFLKSYPQKGPFAGWRFVSAKALGMKED